MSRAEEAAKAARRASRVVATLDTDRKNDVLRALADRIELERKAILAANGKDMERSRADGLASAKLRRLELNDDSIGQLCEGLRQVADLPDPIGTVTRDDVVPSGLHVRKVRAPLGVVMMIYEARPGVTVDAFALCFKAGNACILKGGKEASESNAKLAEIVRSVLSEHDVPEAAITVVTGSDRDELKELLAQEKFIDLVIPRGGEPLIRFVHEHSRIPTVQHFHGVCHIFVDETADLEQAVDICATAKASAPATCNAVECILVHERAADRFVPAFAERCERDGIEIHASHDAVRLAPGAKPATDDDWGREYLDLVLALRIVPDIDGAIDHIQQHGSSHTDAILTANPDHARRFQNEVQSSCVLVNASTRFNDGFQLGLGAEIGISTSRIHAFGPMGLEELTTQRFVVEGSGQTR